MSVFKLGRLQRAYDAHIPHMSALLAGTTIPTPPPSIDWTEVLPKPSAANPAPLGMMLNDKLGDCTCAAVYHALQVWSANAQATIDAEPDVDVEKLYILACGYNPRTPGEEPGGVEQKVLSYLLKKGAPVGSQGKQTHKIAAYVEVDPRNTDDVKNMIADCGVAYIGCQVPQYIIPQDSPPLQVWNVQNTNTTIVGGHGVVLAGYDASYATVISWGSYYKMGWDFFAKYVDEVYAIADADWISAKGTTPGGLSLDELEQQMQALTGN